MRILTGFLKGLAIVPLLLGGAVNAEEYPSSTITFVVPFAAGGNSDLLARKVATMLEESWGKPVVIENHPGGNAVIGTDFAARSAPDGHTVLMVTDAFTINPSLRKSLPYDTATAFAPVTMMASTPLVLVAHPSLGVSNVAELVELAKSEPGKITFGSSGAGGPAHLSVELLSLEAGIQLKHVPYTGAGPALTDLLGGHISLLFNALPPTAELIGNGQLVALGNGAPERDASLPDLPTVAEQGFDGFEGQIWSGLVVPAATSPEVVQKLSDEIVRILNEPEMVEWLKLQGYNKIASSSVQFGEHLIRQTGIWADVIEELGLEQN